MVKDTVQTKERRDGLMTKAKILSIFMQNPTLTTEEIAKKADVARSTVSLHLSQFDISRFKDEFYQKWLDNDLQLYRLAQREMLKRLSNPKLAKDIPTRDLLTMIDHVTKRISFCTERIEILETMQRGGNTEHEVLNEEQKEAIEALSMFMIQKDDETTYIGEVIDGSVSEEESNGE